MNGDIARGLLVGLCVLNSADVQMCCKICRTPM